ncbi:hypothetical protein E1263_34290 [Kribbella antibiotica]|uniref:Uncharacterized protein n=1 Tax=Kribbella antibiotica TaxID=190195 RepID=A0A4R4YQW7_9ACTN|nr:hypothetical protein [Kribbella antibiotica]TDD47571.1 hypothetical protein E1263_34290 [Kribbella antibiotica]
MSMTRAAVEPAPAGRRLPAVAAGYAGLVAVGFLLGVVMPIISLLFLQLAGLALDAPWAPFGDDPEGKTQIGIYVLVLIGLPLLAGAVLIARSVRRRLAAGLRTTVLHYAAALVLLVIPILIVHEAVIA